MSKVLLITGASRGIGAETARLAAARGYSLCLNYLHAEQAANDLLDSLLAGGYREFQPYLGECRFNDCLHLGEPGCAVLAALENGRIIERRMQSYRRLQGQTG